MLEKVKDKLCCLGLVVGMILAVLTLVNFYYDKETDWQVNVVSAWAYVVVLALLGLNMLNDKMCEMKRASNVDGSGAPIRY